MDASVEDNRLQKTGSFTPSVDKEDMTDRSLSKTLNPKDDINPDEASGPNEPETGMGRAFLRVVPILGNELCERLAYYGIAINIVIYLLNELNESTSNAVQHVNLWSGTCNLTPLFGAWIADTVLGRFKTIFTFSIIYMAGLTGLSITAGVKSLTPQEGENPTSLQLGLFWLFMYLVALGTGGIKPCVSTFGADQFDENNPRELAMIPRFYNYFYGFINIGAFLAATLIVWIQTDISWMVGFIVPTGSFAVAAAIFLAGSFWYRHKPPGGSPLTRWFKVVAGTIAHWRAKVPDDARLLHEVDTPMSIVPGQPKLIHTPDLGWLDKAAVTTKPPGVKDRWLITITEVEEFKCVIRLVPFMAVLAIYYSIYAQMSTVFVIQGSAMDRHLGSWAVPAAMVNVLDTISVLIWIPIYDLILDPYFTKIGCPISRLTRMGIGFFIAIVSMIAAACVEIVRLKVVARHNLEYVDPTDNSVPVSVWWQIPQYFLVGMSEVFASVGALEFFYSQSPEAMRSVASALNLLSMGIGNYIATGLAAIVTRITTDHGGDGWLADNLNMGHMDYYFFMMSVIMAVGILAYIPICLMYRYRQDPSVGLKLASDADKERALGRASVGAPDLEILSSCIHVDRKLTKMSTMPTVHSHEIITFSYSMELRD